MQTNYYKTKTTASVTIPSSPVADTTAPWHGFAGGAGDMGTACASNPPPPAHESCRRLSSCRYPSIDVLRGIALISMVSSHIQYGDSPNMVGRVLHSGKWIDGAFFFVALSGVVTGLVHRRVVERSGLRASVKKLLRRAAFLYVVHCTLSLTILTAFNYTPHNDIQSTPTWTETGGVWRGIEQVLFLQLQPNDNSILSMYVAFLAWAVAVVIMLRRGLWLATIGVSIAVYMFGQMVNGVPVTPGTFQLANWQLLFTAGLLAGWAWEHERHLIFHRWRKIIVCSSMIVACALFICAHVLQDSMQKTFGTALLKFDGGWLAFLYAGAALVTGYVLVSRARRFHLLARALRVLEVLGTKGLPGYVTMVLAILALGLFPGSPRSDLMVAAIIAACALSELAATHLTRRKSAVIRETAQLRQAPGRHWRLWPEALRQIGGSNLRRGQSKSR